MSEFTREQIEAAGWARRADLSGMVFTDYLNTPSAPERPA